MNVVVAGGGTIAPVDDVRRLTNLSTGRLAAQIAEACLEQGARVTYLHPPGAMTPFHRLATFALDASEPAAEHARLEALRVRYLSHRARLNPIMLEQGTVAQYHDALKALLQPGAFDVAILPIAVSDYIPEPVHGKIRSELDELVIRCRRAPKIIERVRDWAPGIYLVGFKLLSGASIADLEQAARDACHANRADLTVANDQAEIARGRHALYLVRPGHDRQVLEPGPDLAPRLVTHVLEWANHRSRQVASP